MMSRLNGETSKQLLYAVLGLFVLTLLAPLAWQYRWHVVRQEAAVQAVLPAPEIVAANHPVIEPQVLIAHESDAIPAAQEQEIRPMVAKIGPLVAENIDLDPSI